MNYNVHPYDKINWTLRKAEIPGSGFLQENVEFPDYFSDNAVNIVSSKYFCGKLGTKDREHSFKHLVNRVVSQNAIWAIEQGFYEGQVPENYNKLDLRYIDPLHMFEVESDGYKYVYRLMEMILEQRFAFNTPVWLNMGNPFVGHEMQASACFIGDIEDNLESIFENAKTEGMIFKRGSGVGTNLSKLRSSKEFISGGGKSSGPISFAKIYDAVAMVTKSGGTSRRAAIMRMLDADHGDIFEFVKCKSEEEKKAKILMDNGYSYQEAYDSVFFQNGNHSVRVTDAFMKCVKENENWYLLERKAYESAISDEVTDVYQGKLCNINGRLTIYKDGKHRRVIETFKAKDLWNLIIESAWETGDPGLTFHDTVNSFNSTPLSGDIVASNPCAEYVAQNNTSCNLGSMNLKKYFSDNEPYDEDFIKDCFIAATALNVWIDKAHYPTEKIAEETKKFKNIGLGYANLGALLASKGIAYDSIEARRFASGITENLHIGALIASMHWGNKLGPFPEYEKNKEMFKKVIEGQLHLYHHKFSKLKKIFNFKSMAIKDHPHRNAQVTLLAPTGCLLPDQLVLSSEGLVPIGSLGDKNGSEWQDIDILVNQENNNANCNKFYVNGKDNCHKIVTEQGYEISGTWKHKIRVIDENGDYIWKPLREVTTNDVAIIKIGGHENLMENKPYVKLQAVPVLRNSDVVFPEFLTEEIAEMLGFYMGNGYSKKKGGIHLCVCDNYSDLIIKTEEWSKIFNTTFSIEKRQGCSVHNIYGRSFAQWLEVNGFKKLPGNHGEGAASAFIPELILKSKTSVLCAFIRGLFEADGTITKYTEISTVSKTLAIQLNTAFAALGIKSRLSAQQPRTDTKGRRIKYRIAVRCIEDLIVFRNKIGFLSKIKKEKLEFFLSDQYLNNNIGLKNSIKHENLLLDFWNHASQNNIKEKRQALEFYHNNYATINKLKEIIVNNPVMNESKIGKLFAIGNFVFSSIVLNENIGVHETYDISVPENNTYIANGFVSHNTIGLMMDCETTGIEPILSLVSYKTLVGGGTLQLVNNSIYEGLRKIKNDKNINCDLDEIKEEILKTGTYSGNIPEFREFLRTSLDKNLPIHWKGHVDMCVVVQPFLSGAISKTINVPNEATIEDIGRIYMYAWENGMKGITIYRDGCKSFQPLNMKKEDKEESSTEIAYAKDEQRQLKIRKPLPDTRQSITHKFSIGGHEGYFTVGLYDDGNPGELFISISKSGSPIRAMLDGWAIMFSMHLQYGTPLEVICAKFENTSFEPAGITSDEEIRFTSSIYDYICKWLMNKFIKKHVTPNTHVIKNKVNKSETLDESKESGPMCGNCGAWTVRQGTCYICLKCGTSTGCS